MFNKWIRELFSFSRNERTGIIGLLVVIFLLVIAGKLIPLLIPEEKTDFTKWEKEVRTFLMKGETKESSAPRLNPVSFNPNLIDSAGLARIGIPAKIAGHWLNYLNKGGRFRNKEGVRKIFGMTDEIYNQINSFIYIEAIPSSRKADEKKFVPFKETREYNKDTVVRPEYRKKAIPEIASIELNIADSACLTAVPGIGSLLASRIIRYRNLLGGYYSVAQLKEVYGLRQENYSMMSPYFNVDRSVVKNFNINFSTIQELGHHPYVGYKTAKKLLRLRDIKGKFLVPGDLNPVITSDSLNRLSPYLKFSP